MVLRTPCSHTGMFVLNCYCKYVCKWDVVRDSINDDRNLGV